jgi:hypothetical protein
MANKLVPAAPEMSGALEAVNKALSNEHEEIEKPKEKNQTIAVRVSDRDYKRLKSLFGAQGLALARAGNLALFYAAEQLQAGRISITKAGIIDRRG